jgi:hypothetical protein
MALLKKAKMQTPAVVMVMVEASVQVAGDDCV